MKTNTGRKMNKAAQEMARLCHASMTPAQRVARAKKAAAASAIVRAAKAIEKAKAIKKGNRKKD
jgi:hypothetical protein